MFIYNFFLNFSLKYSPMDQYKNDSLYNLAGAENCNFTTYLTENLVLIQPKIV